MSAAKKMLLQQQVSQNSMVFPHQIITKKQHCRFFLMSKKPALRWTGFDKSYVKHSIAACLVTVTLG